MSFIEMVGPLEDRLAPSVVARALSHGIPMAELLAPHTTVTCHCPALLSRTNAARAPARSSRTNFGRPLTTSSLGDSR